MALIVIRGRLHRAWVWATATEYVNVRIISAPALRSVPGLEEK